MSKYIQIFMKAAEPISHRKRKEYLDSLYGNCYEHRFGMIEKFVKAVGYNDILTDMVSDFPSVFDAKIKSPEDYTMPDDLLREGLHIDLGPRRIAQFVIPMGSQKHPDRRFSYSHKVLCGKFVNFLRKVYPELCIEAKVIEDYEMSLKDFTLDFFYKSMDVNGIHFTIEFAAHRLLENDEIASIEKVLKEAFDYPVKVSQYYCETCEKYHPGHPYHTEIEYL